MRRKKVNNIIGASITISVLAFIVFFVSKIAPGGYYYGSEKFMTFTDSGDIVARMGKT